VTVHDPNSRLGRARIWLASWLDPNPDAGETWCMGCSFNDGQTLVLPADGMHKHAARHREAEGDHKYLRLRTSWPSRELPEPPS
jgi:hypothetical protein